MDFTVSFFERLLAVQPSPQTEKRRAQAAAEAEIKRVKRAKATLAVRRWRRRNPLAEKAYIHSREG